MMVLGRGIAEGGCERLGRRRWLREAPVLSRLCNLTVVRLTSMFEACMVTNEISQKRTGSIQVF